jgi:hypothetical protein
MKLLMLFVMRIYPRAWRERYGAELEALLDDTGINGRIACDVLRGALLMRVQRWKRIGLVALVPTLALLAASWWIGQRPYVTSGSHQVFHMDSNAGALLEGLVIVSLAIVGLAFRKAARAGRVCACIAMLYLAALVLVSLLTPRTIVSIGDGYCWDLWCIGVEQVNASPSGQNIRYTAEVRIFSDANRVPTHRENGFLYVLDDRGRRFDILQSSSAVPPMDIDLGPHEAVRTSLSFVAPANARKLYLIGDQVAMPWVYLCFGSDISPLHRRALLRIL